MTWHVFRADSARVETVRYPHGVEGSPCVPLLWSEKDLRELQKVFPRSRFHRGDLWVWLDSNRWLTHLLMNHKLRDFVYLGHSETFGKMHKVKA